jgi:hypothetical protein
VPEIISQVLHPGLAQSEYTPLLAEIARLEKLAEHLCGA